MGRSPSPSSSKRREKNRDREHRVRKRSRDRDGYRRERDRDRSPERERRDKKERSRSFDRERSHSRDRDSKRSRRQRADTSGPSGSSAPQRPNVSEADLEGKTPDEQEMMKAMGFCGFDSTKNKKVDGNDAGEVHVILKRKYRQYMNRKGGFNRPLDFVA